MKKEEFNNLWKKGFEEKIKEILFCCSPRIYFDENKKEIIFEKYNSIRNFIKERYMDKETDDNGEKKRIDRHKIASIMMKAILIAEPFQLSNKDTGEIPYTEEMPILGWLANEFFAIYCANVIVSAFLIDETKDEEQKKIYETGLVIPISKHGEDYLLQLAKELYYNKMEGNFDVFAFSNILFLLEQYTIAINNPPQQQ